MTWRIEADVIERFAGAGVRSGLAAISTTVVRGRGRCSPSVASGRALMFERLCCCRDWEGARQWTSPLRLLAT